MIYPSEFLKAVRPEYYIKVRQPAREDQQIVPVGTLAYRFSLDPRREASDEELMEQMGFIVADGRPVDESWEISQNKAIIERYQGKLPDCRDMR